MRRTLAAAAVAASIAGGALVGAVAGAPSLAGAATVASGTASWVEEALSGLVGDGTLTQEQADAVETALAEARPERGPGRGRFGRHVDAAAVAEALGITEDELRSALADGQTLAQVAEDQAVDPQVVVDAIVEAQRQHLAVHVAAGDLTQEQADARLALTEERATAVVNGEPPPFGGRLHRHGPTAADDTHE